MELGCRNYLYSLFDLCTYQNFDIRYNVILSSRRFGAEELGPVVLRPLLPGHHRQKPEGMEGGGVRGRQRRLRQLHHGKIHCLCIIVTSVFVFHQKKILKRRLTL